MKKIFLFAAISALAMTGCSDDDAKTPSNSTNYLVGDWSETKPTANAHKIKFINATSAVFTNTDGSKDSLDYKVQNSKLLFFPKGKTVGGTTHDLEKVNDSIIKLSSIYPTPTNGVAVIATFAKQ